VLRRTGRDAALEMTLRPRNISFASAIKQLWRVKGLFTAAVLTQFSSSCVPSE
jgi:hypothetical protein